jgi:hypothetical protein
MKFPYFAIHPGKNPPPQNGYRLKFVLFLKSTGFASSTFPIETDFSQNQPAAITLNTGTPRTLIRQPSREIFAPARDFFEPDRKLLPRPVQL